MELTQKALVSRLHKLGYRDVTERRIADWKHKGLMPAFDCRGAGLGKGKGKAEGTWADGREIVERAIWVHRLLAIYRNSESLHLPLWVLGYGVPVELVRAALTEPLEGIAKMFEIEANSKFERVEAYERKDGIIEDYIGDLSHDWVRKEQFAEIIGIPQEVIEATMNIFFNPDYDVRDLGFEDGKLQLAEWNKRLSNEIVPILSNGFDARSNPQSPIRPDLIETVFSHPGFFQQRLSVEALRKVVIEASEHDFQNIQQDLQIVRTVVVQLGKMIVTLMNHAKLRRLPTLQDVLPDLFRIANLLVLVDLSMRRHGLGQQLDDARTEVTKRFQDDFSQVTEEELAIAGPVLREAVKKGIKELRNKWTTLLSERAHISPRG